YGCADVDIRVENGANHSLLGLASRLGRAASPPFRVGREARGLAVAQRAGLLPVHELKGMSARKPPHLFEAFDGHQDSQRLALPLDDELVVSKGYPIQHVPNSLTDLHRGNSVGHS